MTFKANLNLHLKFQNQFLILGKSQRWFTINWQIMNGPTQQPAWVTTALPIPQLSENAQIPWGMSLPIFLIFIITKESISQICIVVIICHRRSSFWTILHFWETPQRRTKAREAIYDVIGHFASCHNAIARSHHCRTRSKTDLLYLYMHLICEQKVTVKERLWVTKSLTGSSSVIENLPLFTIVVDMNIWWTCSSNLPVWRQIRHAYHI